MGGEKDIMLTLFVTLILFFGIVVSIFTSVQKEINFVTNGLIAEDGIQVLVNQEQTVNWQTLADHDISVVKNSITANNVKGMYWQNDVLLPVKSGRNLTATDFYQGKRVALIGEKRQADVKHNQLKLFGENYTVVGRLGVGYASKLDNLVVVNLDALERDELSNGLYVIGGTKKERVLTALTAEKTPGIAAVQALDIQQPSITHMTQMDLATFGLTLVATGITVVGLMIGVLLGLKKREQAIILYDAVGIRKWTIFKTILVTMGSKQLLVMLVILSFATLIIPQLVLISLVVLMIRLLLLLVAFSVLYALGLLVFFNRLYQQVGSDSHA